MQPRTFLLVSHIGSADVLTSSLVAQCGEWYAEAVHAGRTCGVRLARRVEWQPGSYRWEKREVRVFCCALLGGDDLPADARAAALALTPAASLHTYAETIEAARAAGALVGATEVRTPGDVMVGGNFEMISRAIAGC